MKKYQILAVATVFLAMERIPAQDVVFRSQTKLVVVNVSVKDKAGNPVTTLKKEDFEVLEDGKKRLGLVLGQDRRHETISGDRASRGERGCAFDEIPPSHGALSNVQDAVPTV